MPSATACAADTEISSLEECSAAAAALGLNQDTAHDYVDFVPGNSWTAGCSQNAHGFWYNPWGLPGNCEDGVRGTPFGDCQTLCQSTCTMRNAVFRLPGWTCADQATGCDSGTTLRGTWNLTLPGGTLLGPSALVTSVLGLDATAADAVCCDVSCAAWSLTAACATGTQLLARFTETTAAGADPQSTCCVSPCSPGTRNDGGWCELCPAGEMSATINATSCAACGAGTFAPAGSAACGQCPAGRTDYDQSAATQCAGCDAGRFSVSGSSAAACAGACSPGSYAAEGSAAGCTPARPVRR